MVSRSHGKQCTHCKQCHVSALYSRVDGFVKEIMKTEYTGYAFEIEKELVKVLDLPLRTLLTKDSYENKINELFLEFFKKQWGKDPYQVIRERELRVKEFVFQKGNYGYYTSYTGIHRAVVSEKDYARLQMSEMELAAEMYVYPETTTYRIYPTPALLHQDDDEKINY